MLCSMCFRSIPAYLYVLSSLLCIRHGRLAILQILPNWQAVDKCHFHCGLHATNVRRVPRGGEFSANSRCFPVPLRAKPVSPPREITFWGACNITRMLHGAYLQQRKVRSTPLRPLAGREPIDVFVSVSKRNLPPTIYLRFFRPQHLQLLSALHVVGKVNLPPLQFLVNVLRSRAGIT